MDFKTLNDKEIYPLQTDDGYLLYAPLSALMVPMSAVQAQKLEDVACGIVHDDTYSALLDKLEEHRRVARTIPMKTSVSEIHKLTILPTFRCNFKCSYCYSAQGRQNKSISFDVAKAAIDYFIDAERTPLRDLWLAVLGGGEPFIESELTAQIIDYAAQRAHQQGFNLGVGLTTNGSLYSVRLQDVMLRHNVHLGVSFEVLEDIQKLQRGHYHRVVETVSRYMNAGVDITVKSIITPSNVNRLCQMVALLHDTFPLVKKYKQQIVEDPLIFADMQLMRDFYDDFTRNFFDAYDMGKKLGIDVYVLASQYVDMLVEHYCGGEMCLNPEGTITVCHRFSSRLEEQYGAVEYGMVDDAGHVVVNNDKLRSLLSHDARHQSKCRRCFAKWHCGGGCLAQSMIYKPEQLDIICRWTRQFIKQILIRRNAL